MSRKATTFRIEPVVMDGLAKLSALLHRPINGLANEALREYVAKRTLALEGELESTLQDLRAYRQRDPDFEQSLARLIEAEATIEDDPAEGEVVSETGPAERAMLKLLNG